MAIPYVALTPPAWVQTFAENLTGLKAIGAQVQHARPDLVSEWQGLIASGNALKVSLDSALNGVGSDTLKYNAALTALEEKSAPFIAWIARAWDFKNEMDDTTDIFGVHPLTLIHDVGQTTTAIANEIASLPGAALDEAGNLIRAPFAAAGALPWGWIGLGVAAVFILPAMLNAMAKR